MSNWGIGIWAPKAVLKAEWGWHISDIPLQCFKHISPVPWLFYKVRVALGWGKWGLFGLPKLYLYSQISKFVWNSWNNTPAPVPVQICSRRAGIVYPYTFIYLMSLSGVAILWSFTYEYRRSLKEVIWGELSRKVPVTTGNLNWCTRKVHYII